MERLLKIGFVYAGRWKLNKSSGIEYELEVGKEHKNLIYTFVVDDQPKYIGKTTRMLFQRMGFYKKPGKRQSTNIRVNAYIFDVLKNGLDVHIFFLPDNGLFQYGGYHINLAAGIEDALIADIDPKWNMRGRTKLEELQDEIVNDEPDGKEQVNMLKKIPGIVAETDVKLGSSYYKKGFFNISKKVSNDIGVHGTKIEIYLGLTTDVIYGWVNRDANPSGAPRIMGGIQLRNWIQSNFKENDLMKVEILSRQSIKLIMNNK